VCRRKGGMERVAPLNVEVWREGEAFCQWEGDERQAIRQ
jgi:hypothetical protein